MPQNTNSGGLIILPGITFLDPRDMDEFVPAIEPQKIPGAKYTSGEDVYDEGQEGNDPLEEYKDGFLNHPCSVTFDFIDPNESGSFRPPDARGMQMHKRQPADMLINLDGVQKPQEIHSNLGASPDWDTGDTLSAGFCKLTPDDMNTLFTDLGKKAAENIASGSVKKEDLVEMMTRDNGIYQGTTLTPLTPWTPTSFEPRNRLANEKKTSGFFEKVVDYIADMHSEDATFKDVADDLLPKYAMTEDKNVIGTSIMSAITHAIGDDKFLPEFLDSFKKISPDATKAVGNFLGDQFPISDKMTSRIQRALPSASPYHAQLVRNHYANTCE
jgi:hypothetical protein